MTRNNNSMIMPAGKVTDRMGVRFAGIVFSGLACIALMGVTPIAHAAPGGGPGGGGPGGGFGGGFGGAPGGGFGPPGQTPDSARGYDYSSPKFQFSVRRTPRKDTESEDTQKPASSDRANEPDFFDRLKNGFGLFGD